MIRSVRAAGVFLTRVPLGGFPYTGAEWRWASAHFPLVGALIGAATGAACVALAPVGPLAAGVLAVGAQMLVTGAFHEDGLADTSDALGGGYDHERVLAILKDSRVGTFGAAAVVVSVVGRAALMGDLVRGAATFVPSVPACAYGPSAPSVVASLALVGCAARVGPVWLMVAMPYRTAAEASRSRDVTRASVAQALAATAWFVVVAGALVGTLLVPAARLLGVVLAMAVVTIVTGLRYRARLGGVTGDFLGATEQLGELAALVVLAWGMP
jgi:adenosylcobinamide-GDP ribazoletransferase